MPGVQEFDNQKTTVSGMAETTIKKSADVEASLTTLKWDFELRSKGRISVPSWEKFKIWLIRALFQ